MVFYSLVFRAHCHATEEPIKVEEALKFVTRSEKLIKRRVSGYFGNPIIVMETQLKRSGEIKDFFLRLKNSELIEKLASTLDKRIDDECNFYLRFDKQKAYEKFYELTTHGDAILLKAKLKAFPARKENAVLALRRFLENL